MPVKKVILDKISFLTYKNKITIHTQKLIEREAIIIINKLCIYFIY